jgi:hypothetical protein
MANLKRGGNCEENSLFLSKRVTILAAYILGSCSLSSGGHNVAIL